MTFSVCASMLALLGLLRSPEERPDISSISVAATWEGETGFTLLVYSSTVTELEDSFVMFI